MDDAVIIENEIDIVTIKKIIDMIVNYEEKE